MIKVRPNMKLLIEFCLKYLDLIVDASQTNSCQECYGMSHMVSKMLEMFAHWHSQQVLIKTYGPTDATVSDEEYRILLQQFVSTCLSHSQYTAILDDAVDCKVEDIVRSVLECGGNTLINAFDKHGRRPLHVAVQSGKHELVSLFLEFGAHVDAVNREGSSAAEMAGERNAEPIQRILSDLLPLTCQVYYHWQLASKTHHILSQT